MWVPRQGVGKRSAKSVRGRVIGEADLNGAARRRAVSLVRTPLDSHADFLLHFGSFQASPIDFRRVQTLVDTDRYSTFRRPTASRLALSLLPPPA